MVVNKQIKQVLTRYDSFVCLVIKHERSHKTLLTHVTDCVITGSRARLFDDVITRIKRIGCLPSHLSDAQWSKH